MVALGLSATGCRVGDGDACEIDSDCESGLVCNMYAKVCTAAEVVCEIDRDCPSELPRCDSGICSAALPTPDVVGGDDVTVADTAGADDTSDAGGGFLTGCDPSDAFGGDFEPDPELSLCPPLATTMLRATTFKLGEAGQPGQGLDVDCDPSTCWPESPVPQYDCEGGVNNAFSALAALANMTLTSAVNKKDLNLLLVTNPETEHGCPFVLLSRSAAAPEEEEGPYRVEVGDGTTECPAGAKFVDACIEDGTLRAGFAAPGEFPFFLPLFGVTLHIPLHDARIVATVTADDAGALTSLDGVVAGVVIHEELLAALALVPTDVIGQDELVELITSQLKPDIDLDGDGTAEAYSAGILIAAEPVAVDGLVGD